MITQLLGAGLERWVMKSRRVNIWLLVYVDVGPPDIWLPKMNFQSNWWFSASAFGVDCHCPVAVFPLNFGASSDYCMGDPGKSERGSILHYYQWLWQIHFLSRRHPRSFVSQTDQFPEFGSTVAASECAERPYNLGLISRLTFWSCVYKLGSMWIEEGWGSNDASNADHCLICLFVSQLFLVWSQHQSHSLWLLFQICPTTSCSWTTFPRKPHRSCCPCCLTSTMSKYQNCLDLP